MFVMGMKLRFPSFKTTAMILKIDKISSFENPRVSNDLFVKTNCDLSSSPEFVSLSSSYLLMFRCSLSDSVSEMVLRRKLLKKTLRLTQEMNVSTGQQLIEDVKVSFTFQLLCDSTLKDYETTV